MDIVNLKCPNCGGSIQMDETREKGICLYCGEKFLAKENIRSGLLTPMTATDPKERKEIANLLVGLQEEADALIADEQLTASEFLEAVHILEKDSIDKILALDAGNQEVVPIKQRLIDESDKRIADSESREDKLDKEFAIGFGAVFLLLVAVIVVIVALNS